MSFCTNCGAQLPDNAKFCNYCGQAVEAESQAVQAGEAPAYEVPAVTEPVFPPEEPVIPETPVYEPPAQSYNTPNFDIGAGPAVTPYNTTGLMIWSILSLLFGALIFGIVALMNTLQINKCATVEEQQKKIKSARTWCIVSTVIGVLAIIGRMAQG